MGNTPQEHFRTFDKVILTFLTKFGGDNEHLFVCGLSFNCSVFPRLNHTFCIVKEFFKS